MNIDLTSNSLQFNKRCIVIGATRLCNTIVDQLKEKQWDILSVISEDSLVRQHSLQLGIPVLFTLEDVKETHFVLFSVANYTIIPSKYLKKRAIPIAINYHDSFLPRYAGVNSTTWAIYNNESSHGVTWHLITAGIDEGGILKQAEIKISPDETVQSLNLRCFALAIDTFQSLLNDFERGQLQVTQQEVRDKTYYGKGYLPDNYGVINFNDSYEKINRLCRSLYFGKQGITNTVATPKIWDGKQVYLIEDVSFKLREDALPGYVYEVNESQLTIGIKCGLLSINSILNSYGTPISWAETNFKEKEFIESVFFDRTERDILSQCKINEHDVSRILSSEQHFARSFCPKLIMTNLNINTEALFKRTISLVEMSQQKVLQKIALVLLKLSFVELCVPICFYKRNNKKFIDKILRHESYLYLAPNQQKLPMGEFFKLVDEQVQKIITFTNDFLFRHQLSNDLYDVGIIILDNKDELDYSLNVQYRVRILISDNKISIEGIDEDKQIIEALYSCINHSLYNFPPEDAKYITDIEVMSQDDINSILKRSRQSEKLYPKSKTIHQIFEEQVAKTPTATAVVVNEDSLTYQELNLKANQLARHIQSEYQRITGDTLLPDKPIPLCVNRSLEMIIAILAILKAGGAYVPIEPSFPSDRVAFIIEDTQSQFILTTHDLKGDLFDGIYNIVCIDDALIDNIYDSVNLDFVSQSTNLAYILYTSGTTGTPKGVMVEHRAVVNTIWGIRDVYNFTSGKINISCYASFSFDVSAAEIYSSLLRGGVLHLLDDKHRYSVECLAKYIFSKEIHHLYLPPAVLAVLPRNDYPSLQSIIFAGEPCDQKVGEYWASRYKVYNYYGPTECAIYATGKRVDISNVNKIGKPLTNKIAYVLDPYMNLVPDGVVGELYIGGEGGVRGYINGSTLTGERFLIDKYVEKGCIYKTGDMVRRLTDGNLEYLGRDDFQVKIRGYRLELSEIEKVISKYPGIQQSVVLVKSGDCCQNNSTENKFLIGFFKAEKEVRLHKLTGYLKSKLPGYMVPRILQKLDYFPMSVSGKLDRKALSNISIDKPQKEPTFPRTRVEQAIHTIWCEVLKVDKIGIDDAFLQIGGNSLHAMEVQVRINSLFDCDCSILTLYQYSTVRSLAHYIHKVIDGDGDTEFTAQTQPQPQVSNEPQTVSTDVAVIGMACRIPDANNPNEFWQNLKAGQESIHDVPKNAVEHNKQISNNYVLKAANIEDHYGFDSKLFGFSPRESQSMDPQHRHFMEVVFEALQDAGYDARPDKERIGLYAGQGENTEYINDVLEEEILCEGLGNYQISINNVADFLTTKVSYKLNLRGPSINIQTACSTSLVAVHVAISQLLAGDCDIAVAGAVSLDDRNGYLYKKGMIASPDGKCRAFDESADGTVISSGVGVVVLKPLHKAINNGDNIHCVIKGSAINNDGGLDAKVGYTAPSISGQTEVILNALKRANIDPATISYIEAHGTGTKIGDPIEVMALHKAFTAYQRRESSIAIGSVKSNIGHTDAAAGVIGLIKTILALKEKQIPQNLHFNKWNPEIESFNKLFYVNKKLNNWETLDNAPRRAGVSSFGIGGTNAHVILEEAPKTPVTHSTRSSQLIVMSAETEASLKKYHDKLKIYVEQQQDSSLAQISYTLQLGRAQRKYRSFVVSRDQSSLSNALTDADIKLIVEEDSSDVVMMFPGQGAQYPNMARDLYETESYFAQQVEECCRILKDISGIELLPLIFTDSVDDALLKQTQHAQPALFVIEYALAKFLINIGIKPTAFIGHSVGEYVAATLAGIFTLEDTLLLIVKRGQMMSRMETGAMLYINYPIKEIDSLIPASLDLAAVNAPTLSVVSGEISDIENFAKTLTELDIRYGKLDTSHAFHSRMMQPVYKEFLTTVTQVQKNEPDIPVISNITGTWLTAEQAQSDQYWCDHVIKAVQFHSGVETIRRDKLNPFFIEVGPGNTLSTLVNQAGLSSNTLATLGSPKQKSNSYKYFLNTIGQLWQRGIDIDWYAFNQDQNISLISLPTYCFEHQQYLPNGGVLVEEEIKKPLEKENLECNNITEKMQEIWSNLLGVTQVKLEDNFFSLGGHSLLATQLLMQIEKHFNVELEIGNIYAHKTLYGLSQYIKGAAIAGEKEDTTIPTGSEINRLVFSSAQQEALGIIQELNDSNYVAYNEPLMFKIKGRFSSDIYKKSWQYLVERHESLRTVFVRDSAGNLQQDILKNVKLKPEELVCHEKDLQELIANRVALPFELSLGPLFRTTVFDLGMENYIVLMVFHHIIIDGASLRILCQEFSTVYNALIENSVPLLETLPKQYRDYASWQAEFFSSPKYKEKINFWKEKLNLYQEVKFFISKKNPPVFNNQGSRHDFRLGTELSLQLKNLARREQTTLFNLTLTAFSVLLSHCSGQEDILVGAPMLNRPAGFQNVIGLFTNTVVLRNKVDSKLSFSELLQQVAISTLQAYQNQEVVFEEIVSQLSIERELGRNPLVQILLLVLNDTDIPRISLNNLDIDPYESSLHIASKFDLSLVLCDKSHGITGYFEYATNIFSKDYIACLTEYLQNVLEYVVQHYNESLQNLSLLSKNSQRKMLTDWSPSYIERPYKNALHEMFQKNATSLGDKIALKFDDKILSYHELDELSTKFAHYLRDKYKAMNQGQSLPKESLIALCLEPSFDTIISILGVLKARAAYVPIDANYPESRIENILTDSNASLIVIQKSISEKVTSLSDIQQNKVIILDDSNTQKEMQSQPVEPLNLSYDESDLAYVIYTSGSTGKPKGVAIPHSNVLDIFYAAKEHYNFDYNDIWPLFHSFAFDVSIWELWGALLHGGTLVILPFSTTRDPHAFYQFTIDEKITVLNQTPSAFRNYIDADISAKEKVESLRYVIFAGEALDIEMLRDWWHSHNDRHPQLVNMYGITETTIHATYQALSHSDLKEAKNGRVGYPLNHLQMYVLDGQMNLCPVGVPGELYVGGRGVARGYLNRDNLTKERFIKNPFLTLASLPEDDCIYKSGDQVCWFPDGSLHYIGRTDFQVKLRGFRIELGEIESVSLKYPLVKQSVVLLREDNNEKYLACYFTIDDISTYFDVNKLGEHLKQSLPDYMVPSAFMQIKSIPLTVNGKIDRLALPKPNFIELSGTYTSPSNELEENVAKIWAEILSLSCSEISVTADYFKLGGNSLSVVRMLSRVKALTEVNIPLSGFWKSPTIQSIAQIVSGGSSPFEAHSTKVNQMIKLDLNLPAQLKPLTLDAKFQKPKRILVTGATGFLGPYLVNELFHIAGVEIYCLIRSKSNEDAKQRLKKIFTDSQLDHLNDAPNIKAICGDIASKNIGLSKEEYLKLADSIDTIYLAGAMVHHLYDYERLRLTNVCATREFIEFAMTRRNKALHFVSTITVRDFDIRQKLAKPGLPWSFMELNGYLLTKWVSEQLLLEVARKGMYVKIYRPGNITGDTKAGYCKPFNNHTLLKVKGFTQLEKAYSDDREMFEMVPVDIVAKDIVSKSLCPQEKIIFNLDNPMKISFESYLKCFFNDTYTIKRVKLLSEWLRILSSLGEDNALYPLSVFYENYDSILSASSVQNNASDLTIPVPSYQKLIQKQVAFLEEIKFLQPQKEKVV